MATESAVPVKHKPTQMVYPLQTGIWRIRNAERSANDIPPEANVFGRGGIFNTHRSKGRHGGWDLQAAVGTAVYAVRGGSILDVGTNDGVSGWGPNHIMHSFTFNDGSGAKEYTIRYAHLSRVSVRNGGSVREGELIGYSGETGVGSPPHLHIEFKLDGVGVNPTKFFGLAPF